MLRRRCFFATLVGGRCSTVSTLHRVWTHSNVSTLPILFDYSHSVQGVRTGRLHLACGCRSRSYADHGILDSSRRQATPVELPIIHPRLCGTVPVNKSSTLQV